MESIRNRATDQFPTVLLTLLSIVQALALELLWDSSRHRPELLDLSLHAAVGWLQFAASLNVIILIWLFYAGTVMRFRLTPTTTDSLLPFIVGLIQFLMIDVMGPEKLGQWLFVVATVYTTMLVLSHRVMRRARRDPDNREFFDRYAPATLRDFLPQIVIIGLVMVLGVAFLQIRGFGWLAGVTLIAVLIGLAYETRNAARYWSASMGSD